MNQETQVNIPFWKKYPTPIYSKEETAKHYYGTVQNLEFNMCTYMSYVAERISRDMYYDRKFRK